jgi:N-acyl-phosphatidylethanolamine-hydrolysing phospholipase D
MAAYSSAVSKLELAADIPEEARQASHHVKGSNGKTVKFQNPHPSAGGPADSVLVVGSKVIW